MNRPNILFLLSDEHSFRFLEHRSRAEGGEPVRTPNLSRLAARGTEFTDTYCAMPLCTPSRLCLLAGREVRACGAWDNESVLRPELPTLPGALAQAGYATCLVGKMHLGGNLQFAGFQHRPYGDLTGQTGHQWEPLQDPRATGMRERTTKAGLTGIPESLLQEQVVATESLAWIRNHDHAQPWFLCASFSRPHFPLTAPARHLDYYLRRGVPPPFVPATGDAYDHPMSRGMRAGFRSDEISPDEMQHARAAYFACVTYLDEIIGDFLARLEATGELDNTIIVYTSDHGELAGEHGVWWKNSWHEASVRVPLIFALPGQRRRRVCRTPVSLLDLFPTLCGLAGAPAPAGLDGIDLSPVLTGKAKAPVRPIYSDALTPRWGAGTEFRMIREGRYKYVHFRAAPPLLFDLKSDPQEQHNLIGHAAGQRLEKLAQTTMDFTAAEQERTVRDAGLAKQYRLGAPPATPNLYLMPSGKLVNAEDILYRPTIIAENLATLFGDWPHSKFRPGKLWLDNNGVHINAHGGGVLFHAGTYYWFGEHKIEGEAGNFAHVGVHCYSSRDLCHWRDEGIALPVSLDPTSDIKKGCVLERPKVIYNSRTKQFVMWFHLESRPGYVDAKSGVAVADSPTGPYRYLRSMRPNAGHWPINVRPDQQDPATFAQGEKFGNGENEPVKQANILGRDVAGGQHARDMTLFQDEDGTAYHIYSSEHNSTTHIAQLTDDYLAHTGRYVRVFEHRWMEAPAICRHAGRYYFLASGCTYWDPNAARSAVADSIWGPWTETGNPCVGVNPENNLGPELTFGGQSTFLLPVAGKPGAVIAMFDIWRPKNAIDGRYVWLPVRFVEGRLRIEWQTEWDLRWFDRHG
jgi:choline-sulfatase